MLQSVIRNPWVRAVGVLLLLAMVALLAYLLSAVLVPLFFAFIVAYIFDPVIDRLEKFKVSRMGAIVGLLIAIMLVGVSFPLFVLPSVLDEAKELKGKAPAFTEDSWVQTVVGRLPESLNTPQKLRQRIVDYVSAEVAAFAESAAVQENASQLSGMSRRAGAVVAGFFSSLGSTILSVVMLVGNFALFAFVTLYLLKDYDDIIAGINELVPPRYRDKVSDIMRRIDIQLRAFLRGQAMVCAFLGLFYAVGLMVCGVPFAIPLALFGMIASFVPYLGLALTLGPAVVLALLAHGVDWHVAGVLVTFVVAQALEGNYLTPKIVGSQVGLGPVWVILAIMVFSSALGFVGLLLAVPIAAVLKVLVVEAIALYRSSAFFAGSSTATIPES